MSREPLLTLPGKRTTLGDNVIKAVFKKKRTVNVFEKQSKRKQGGLKKKSKNLIHRALIFQMHHLMLSPQCESTLIGVLCVGDRTR